MHVVSPAGLRSRQQQTLNSISCAQKGHTPVTESLGYMEEEEEESTGMQSSILCLHLCTYVWDGFVALANRCSLQLSPQFSKRNALHHKAAEDFVTWEIRGSIASSYRQT